MSFAITVLREISVSCFFKNKVYKTFFKIFFKSFFFVDSMLFIFFFRFSSDSGKDRKKGKCNKFLIKIFCSYLVLLKQYLCCFCWFACQIIIGMKKCMTGLKVALFDNITNYNTCVYNFCKKNYDDQTCFFHSTLE